MKKIVSTLILATLMSGCGIYSKYERPQVETDGLYRDSTVTADTSSLASLPWRGLFTDQQLQSLIEQGLTNNTDLRIARLRVTEAQASLLSARLAYLPSLSLAPQGSLGKAGSNGTTKSYQLPVNASWEIDVFGKLTNAKRGSLAALEQGEAYRQAVQTQLIANIANSYYTLLMLDSQLDISRQTSDNWKENLKVMRALKQAGQANEAAVAQAEANSLAVEASLLSLKQQINETENSLSILLGEMPQSIGRGKLENQTFPDTLAAGIPLQLLGNRPDVREAEAALKQTFYSTNASRAAFYPGITLSGTAGWTNSLGNAISNPGSLLLQAIGTLTQPLFNRGTNIARLKIAKAQQEEATLSFQQSLLNAGAEVNNALTQFQTAQQKSSLTTRQVVSLETAVRSTRLLMQHGTSTYLEVLTAQQSLLSAQLTQVSERFDEIQGVINLYQALGGGSDK